MIVVFSSNIDGGILQYAMMIVSEVDALGKECLCYIPDGAKVTIPEHLKDKIRTYEKVKTINKRDVRIRNLAERILDEKPDLIWYAESTIVSAQVCQYLKGKVKQYITVHDPAQDHPTNHVSMKYRLKKFYEHRMRKESMVAANQIVVPSMESYEKYIAFEPQHKDKVVVFPLGAILPNAKPYKPVEIPEKIPYFLFFGRIDKYKGIANMLKAYADFSRNDFPLVIAGKGEFSEEEKALLAKEDRKLVLQRYIEDGEMLWLLQHAKACILPYIEASQSGILPNAYYYGVPVITSNEKGLTQFVEDGVTGRICTSISEMTNAMEEIATKEIEDSNISKWADHCKKYYLEHLDWKNNLMKMEILNSCKE